MPILRYIYKCLTKQIHFKPPVEVLCTIVYAVLNGFKLVIRVLQLKKNLKTQNAQNTVDSTFIFQSLKRTDKEGI